MATTTTQIGPIGTRQINRSLYVGQSDLTTIQKAVNVAASIGGLFVVIIPFDYAGSDAISAVTGGTASIDILDVRGGQRQTYNWSGANYVPTDFYQLSGITAFGAPLSPYHAATSLDFDIGGGNAGAGGGNLFVSANNGMGFPLLSLVVVPHDGISHATAMLQCGNDVNGILMAQFNERVRVIAPDATEAFWLGQPELTNGKGLAITAQAANNLIIFQGQTTGGAYDQTISLNPQGGSVQIGPITFDAAGNIIGIDNLATASLTTSSLTADDADFDTCEVNSSPVRTFANTPDGPGQGMVWPPNGVPVSLGDHWQSSSIDPTSLATWPAAGVPVSTGTAWGTSINPATLAHFPAAGVAVSTGSAWGTPIDPTTIPRLAANNIFTGTNTMAGNLLVIGNQPPIPVTAPNQGFAIAWNIGNGTGDTNFINSHGAGGGAFSWFNVASGAVVGPATVPNMALQSNGVLLVWNGFLGSSIRLGAALNAGAGQNISISGSGSFFDAYGINTTTLGTFNFRTMHSDTSGMIVPMVVNSTGVSITGSLTATTKSFLIPHPLDETKNLVHGSIEGPEFAVLYRGEGVTGGGWAEISLPDYFEALVQETDRTVLLTALFEDDAEQIGMLAASRVKDGKFKVWSALGTQKFYWEVKAVRGDIEALDTEPIKPEPLTYQLPEEEPK